MKINLKSKTLFASVFMMILIMTLFNQVIFSGKSFGSPDTLSPKAVGIALNDYSDQSGEFPQWQPWIFSGMPSAEAFSHISKLYFPEHLFKLFMLPGMMIQMLHLLFAGLGCFLLLRHFKINYLSSILGSVGFMLTPYMTVMVVHGHGSQMMTAAYIPWIFWFTVKLWENPNIIDTGFLAILMGFQLQRAHAQIAYYTWMLIGAYSLLILIKRFREEPDKKYLIQKSKIIIMISDGEDFGDDTESVANDIESSGIKLFTLGVGTDTGSKISDGRGFKKDKEGNDVITQLDSKSLKKLNPDQSPF